MFYSFCSFDLFQYRLSWLSPKTAVSIDWASQLLHDWVASPQYPAYIIAFSAFAADMGTKLLRLLLHEAEAFDAKASASALWFQKLNSLASASWFGKSFGFVTSQIHKAKASVLASASCFQKVKALASASWFDQSFGFASALLKLNWLPFNNVWPGQAFNTFAVCICGILHLIIHESCHKIVSVEVL